jgi:hypothetical protein
MQTLRTASRSCLNTLASACARNTSHAPNYSMDKSTWAVSVDLRAAAGINTAPALLPPAERVDDRARQVRTRLFALRNQVLEHFLHPPQVAQLVLDLA